MRIKILFPALVLLLAFTTACGPLAFLSPAQATATPAPAAIATKPAAGPTATQPAATAPTAVPTAAPTKAGAAPTVAPTKPAAQPTTATGGDFFSLWSNVQGRTASATKFRMSMSMIIGATENGVYKEAPLMVSEGWTVGKDSYQAFTGGMMNDLLGGTKIEMIQAGGTSYMKGGAMFGLMDPTKWYSMSDSTSPPIEPSDLLGMSGLDSAAATSAKKTGTETLDGQSCDVWVWSIAQTSSLLGLLANPTQATDLSVTDKSEVKSWICRDNYVHKVVMEISGHAKDNVNEKGGMKFDIHIWDFDNPTLSVTAPVGAVPFGN